MGNFGETVLNPLGALFTIIMCVIILVVRREKMIVPVIILSCFITQMQRVVIFGVDMPMIRIILLFGFLRVMLSNEKSTMTFNSIDKLIVYFTLCKVMIYTLLWGDFGALKYMLGQSYEVVGIYFLVRLTVSDIEDFDSIVKTIIIASIPIAIFMVVEHRTEGWNFFSIFGGVPEYDLIREGKLRAQGAFSHPILAGTFGATMIPLAWGLWHRNYKALAFSGLISAYVITIESSSSGPLAAMVAGIFGIFFWKFNKYTKQVRNLFFLTLVFLHVVMKAPVWHLISRIDLVGGSTGYHRYMLIDAAVHNFSRWFILGIKDTGPWGRGLNDITNQYILEGVRGGLISVILFILIIAKCFQYIGIARARLAENQELQKYIWALGVVMFAHVVSFISVSYFGQIVIFYYMLIGMISSLNNFPSIVADKKT